MKAKIIEVLENCLSVSDEWGGSKLAEWRWGNDVLVAGIEEAAEELERLLTSAAPDLPFTAEQLQPPTMGDISFCKMCHEPIEYIGPYCGTLHVAHVTQRFLGGMMSNKMTTLKEQIAAINTTIQDLEHLHTDEATLHQELVDRRATLKDAKHTISWLHSACVFIEELWGYMNDESQS